MWLASAANTRRFRHLLPGYPHRFGAFAKMQIRDRRVLCGRADRDGDVHVREPRPRSKYVA